MATYFVDSVGGSSSNSGAAWGTAYNTIAVAISGTTAAGSAALAAGDVVYVGDNHAETGAAAITWTFPGTLANPNFIYCTDHNVATPTSTTLKLTGTASNTGTVNWTMTGSFYMYGLNIHNGTSGGNFLSIGQGGNYIVLDSCTLTSCSTAAGGTIKLGNAAGSWLNLNNTTVSFGHTGGNLVTFDRVTWRNTASAVSSAVVPLNLFKTANTSFTFCEGVDFSAITSGNTLFNPAAAVNIFTTFKDCKLASGVTVASNIQAGNTCYVVRSDSAATNYIEQVYNIYGTQTDETSVTRVGGASDGVTSKSRKIVTTANPRWTAPYEANPIAIWNDVTGVAKTITVFGTWKSTLPPNNDQIWIDTVTLNSSTTPLGTFTTATKANNLATGTALSTDTSVWNSSGSSTNFTPFKMSVSTTPMMKGPITIYIKAASASSTFYIDPAPTVV